MGHDFRTAYPQREDRGSLVLSYIPRSIGARARQKPRAVHERCSEECVCNRGWRRSVAHDVISKCFQNGSGGKFEG